MRFFSWLTWCFESLQWIEPETHPNWKSENHLNQTSNLSWGFHVRFPGWYIWYVFSSLFLAQLLRRRFQDIAHTLKTFHPGDSGDSDDSLVGGPNCLRHTKKRVEQDMSSHRFSNKKWHIYMIWCIYIYDITVLGGHYKPYKFSSQKNQDDLQMHGTSHRSQGMSPSRWWDQSTNVHGQKHPTSPPRWVKLGGWSSRIFKTSNLPQVTWKKNWKPIKCTKMFFVKWCGDFFWWFVWGEKNYLWGVVSPSPTSNWATKKKTTFHYTGWLIGILIMLYHNLT